MARDIQWIDSVDIKWKDRTGYIVWYPHSTATISTYLYTFLSAYRPFDIDIKSLEAGKIDLYGYRPFDIDIDTQQ